MPSSSWNIHFRFFFHVESGLYKTVNIVPAYHRTEWSSTYSEHPLSVKMAVSESWDIWWNATFPKEWLHIVYTMVQYTVVYCTQRFSTQWYTMVTESTWKYSSCVHNTWLLYVLFWVCTGGTKAVFKRSFPLLAISISCKISL